MKNEAKLRITSKALAQLQSKGVTISSDATKADGLEAQRKLRVEERAFQEQLRHKRKEALQAAKQSDVALHTACDEDDAAVKVQTEDRMRLHALKTSANRLEIEAKKLDTEIKRLQLLWRDKRAEYGITKDLLHAHAVNMAIRSPKRTQTKVTEAYAACGEAWTALPTALVKKARDRTARKRAKVIRGRPSS